MKKSFTKFLGAFLCAFLLVPNSAKAKVTAKWDFGSVEPSTLSSVNIQYNSNPNTTYIASNVAGYSMYVDASNSGKLQYNSSGYAQMNAGTLIHIPVVSTNDKITITSGGNSTYLTIDGENVAGTPANYDVTAADVERGYVILGASNTTYPKCITVELAFIPETKTAAKWTFDTAYSVDGSTYTPTSGDYAETPQSQSKAGQIPQIIANEGTQTLSSCIASIGPSASGNIYWKLHHNYQNPTSYGKDLALWPYNRIRNTSTDFTNESNHIVYYEFKFPTQGLSHIQISYDITYHNNTSYPIHVAYSTDNGTTWKVGTTGSNNANWWLYTTNVSNIDAANQDKVIVRLLPEMPSIDEGQYTWFYLNNFIVTGRVAATSVTISDAKYATYYNSIPVQLPANLQAATVDNETSGALAFNYRYAEGDVIPGGTPVLLKATAAGDYTLTYAANVTTAAPTGNYLYGSDVATTTTGGGTGAKYYALQYGIGSNASVLGFYWAAADGAAFTSGAHKAWLALPAASTARFFSLDDDVTAINAAKSQLPKANGQYFDLQGRRVAQPTRGLYIVNGKKVIVK